MRTHPRISGEPASTHTRTHEPPRQCMLMSAMVYRCTMGLKGECPIPREHSLKRHLGHNPSMRCRQATTTRLRNATMQRHRAGMYPRNNATMHPCIATMHSHNAMPLRCKNSRKRHRRVSGTRAAPQQREEEKKTPMPTHKLHTLAVVH
jgi:hypothetical protein